jgi:hypothetical protein
MQKTKVAIIGAGFITNIHMESYHRFVPEAEGGGSVCEKD